MIPQTIEIPTQIVPKPVLRKMDSEVSESSYESTTSSSSSSSPANLARKLRRMTRRLLVEAAGSPSPPLVMPHVEDPLDDIQAPSMHEDPQIGWLSRRIMARTNVFCSMLFKFSYILENCIRSIRSWWICLGGLLRRVARGGICTSTKTIQELYIGWFIKNYIVHDYFCHCYVLPPTLVNIGILSALY